MTSLTDPAEFNVLYYDKCAERCSRIIAKLPLESAVKAWFYNLTNSLQQIMNDEGAFPALFPCSILTLVSNCRNVHSASLSFSKDGCIHTVKSVLRLAKWPNNFTSQISAHEIHLSYAKTQLWWYCSLDWTCAYTNEPSGEDRCTCINEPIGQGPLCKRRIWKSPE